MAKLVIRALQNFNFAMVKAVFDEVAQDCPLLVVSSEEVSSMEYKLILTIDTDLVAKITLYTNSSSIGTKLVTFNGNSLMSVSTGYGVSNPKLVIAYTDSFFLFLILSGNSPQVYVLYEKLANEKFAYASDGGFYFDLYDTSKTKLTRRLMSATYTTDQGYIDYMDKTLITRSSGTRLSEFDSNFVYVMNSVNIQFSIITMDNKDYYALTNQFLIPIDSE